MRIRSAPFAAIAGLLFLAAAPPAAHAQRADAVLRGVVRSQGGRPIAAARIGTSDGANHADSDSAGRFTLFLPAGDARITVTALGFRPVLAAVAALRAGDVRPFPVTLAPFYTLSAQTIVAQPERPLLNTENAATGGSIESRELRSLPTDGRDPIALLYNIPGITQATGFFGDAPTLSFNGQNSLYSSYLLDGLDNNEGFLGGPRVEFPLAGLDRIDAHVNTYSTEFGRSPSGIVNQLSRGGTNQRHGELFVYGRPGTALGVDGTNKVPYGAVPAAVRRTQDGFKRSQLGGAMSGPLLRDRTFYSVAAEYTDETEDRIGSTAVASFLGTERRQKAKLFGRIDRAWSATQFTTVRAAFSVTDRAGTGSGIVTPEADNVTRREGGVYAITHRSVMGAGMSNNTFQVQAGTYHWYFPPAASSYDSPQVTIVGPGPGFVPQAVVGSTNFVFDNKEFQLQLRDTWDQVLTPAHTLRVGGDIVSSRFSLFAAGTNPRGAYTVVNNGDINPPAGRRVTIRDVPATVQVLSYTVDARPQQVDLSQTVYGAFVEDRWKASENLLVIAGLRYDFDDITTRGQSKGDYANLQPRLSFNWYNTPRSVIRGGVGMYAGKLPYATFSDARQLGVNGNATVTLSGASAPAFNGTAPPVVVGPLPAREIFADFPLGLKTPLGYQATAGYQFQVGDDWGFSADVVWTHTVHLPRLVDLNPINRSLTSGDTANRVCGASCPGDPFRPIAPTVNSFRRLSAAESGGEAEYVGLYFSARKRLSHAWTVDANYVLSRAMTDAEDINFSATQANCFSSSFRDAVSGQPCASSEWGRANNDRLHRATVRAIWTPFRALRVSVVSDLQSGQPLNRIAGVTVGGAQSRYDLLGSGPIRGNSFIGNNDRYLGVDRNSEQLPHYASTNLSLAYLVPLAGGDVEMRADLFNAFNATSWAGFATGTGGNGNVIQTGRPGDAIYNFTPGPPRQLQLSVRWSY